MICRSQILPTILETCLVLGKGVGFEQTQHEPSSCIEKLLGKSASDAFVKIGETLTTDFLRSIRVATTTRIVK